ncbi:MAG: hypothetical protein Q8835_03260, partial [Sweet potato little leaf phytoplasma]|nr:hypothetical protein [Sweet potato little leaf phytoplasma]
PLLANVYLHYIDLKMEELIKEGKPIRKSNPEYWKAWKTRSLKRSPSLIIGPITFPKPGWW